MSWQLSLFSVKIENLGNKYLSVDVNNEEVPFNLYSAKRDPLDSHKTAFVY